MIICKKSAVPDISRKAVLANKHNYKVTYRNIMPEEHFPFLPHKNSPLLDRLN